MISHGSLPASYFEAKYKTDIDPWRFRTSEYERQKYCQTLKALAKPRYARGLEAGCSIGVLTRKLAMRCDHLLAMDASERAIVEARCLDLPNVKFEMAYLPSEFPKTSFDLIVLSEVLYYLSADDLRLMANLCVDFIADGGEIILCHWLGETDYPLTGYQASDLFAATVAGKLPDRRILNDQIYRLERLSF